VANQGSLPEDALNERLVSFTGGSFPEGREPGQEIRNMARNIPVGRGFSPYVRPKRKLSKRAIDNINSRKDDRVVTVCGCIVIPEIIGRLIGSHPKKESVMCPAHGWQAIEHKAATREVLNAQKGLPLDYRLMLPDEPPF
jgi:hypothetical protein